MPVDRPTFSESWYRIAGLRPTLRSTVQITRQHFRGQTWHVIEDPANNQFFRLNESAYQFVGMLDGNQTVADVWQKCNEILEDSAPTQGEVVQLLGQLYTSNLIRAELPPDAESLFRRYDKRVTREIQSYLMNLLFIRIPLYDPDRFLDRWVGIFGKMFSFPGFIVWLALIITGLSCIVGRVSELATGASNVLDPSNLPFLYIGMVLTKVCHEFGHAFACKKFGVSSGQRGEVHVMGVMFLVFTPLPYVDATSAWAFRRKWHRAVVGAGGMLVELALASLAAVVWANTRQGTALHAISYNMMFIAGVSTLLFNGNPLLRYDGYYILSDVLEIPNLAQRGKQYLYYLVRKYVWGVRRVQNPAHSRGESIWLAAYAVSSFIYRIFVCIAILIFVASRLFFVGVILAAASVVTWVFVPLGSFAYYLFTSNELDRVRYRAMATSAAALIVIIMGTGIIPWPQRCRFEGVVEPAKMAVMHAETSGFLRSVVTPSNSKVKAGDELIRTENPELESNYQRLLADRRKLFAQMRLAELDNRAAAQALREQISALDERIAFTEHERQRLIVRAPFAGQWVAPKVDTIIGAYLNAGDQLGIIASTDGLIVRGIGRQDVAAQLYEGGRFREIELRIKDRPEPEIAGQIIKILPAGQEQLPSASLGYMAGGGMPTAPDDKQGVKASERFFEIQVVPESSQNLRSGQRVVVRAKLPSEPLAFQWWRSALRLVQRRFQI